MKRPTKLALAAFAAVCLTLPLHAIYEVSDSGLWPTNWPKELEPLRKQARTLAHDQFVVYEIPFTDRQQIETAWPHLLAVKSPEAPLTLLKSPDQWLGANRKAGVRIRAPLTGSLISPKGSRYPPSAEGDYDKVLDMALARLGDKARVGRVGTHLVESPSPTIRVCAALTLRLCGDRSAIPALKNALRDPYQRKDGSDVGPRDQLVHPIRILAADALVEMGENAKEVREMMRGLDSKIDK